ncbi:MAG: hypothetical protein WDW36_006784 [Sanguina aurantia]
MMRAQDVGILAVEIYTPNKQVLQEDLEAADGCPGKYTVGLGQVAMSFCDDREDVISMALTVSQRLMELHQIAPSEIGRLEVASESGLDRSKSIKSHLMRLFSPSGCSDMEGADSCHGCYGSTAALLNAVAWVGSDAWDGRFALVVATDIALYTPGTAACATGGCGAAALLVGPHAPLVLERPRCTYAHHVDDFCKPCGRAQPYPVVDGPLTVTQYLLAADRCYSGLEAKQGGVAQALPASTTMQDSRLRGVPPGLLQLCDFAVFHAPFNKIVTKAFARMFLAQLLRAAAAGDAEAGAALHAAVSDSAWAQQRTGNTYTACLFTGLAGLLSRKGPAQLQGRRILMFGFGSGLIATMYSLAVRCDSAAHPRFTLQGLCTRLHLAQDLDARVRQTAAQFAAASLAQESMYGRAPFTPSGEVGHLSPGTYYLTGVGESYARSYACTPLA